MAVVGKLTALLTVNSAGFTAGMAAASATTAKLGATATSVSGAVTGLAGAMGATAAAATGLSAKLWGMAIAAGAALKAMLPLAAALAAFYALIKAGKTAEGFNQAMKSSLAIMGDVGDAGTRMAQIAKQVAYDTKFSNQEVAESYYFLASAGLKAEQQMAALSFVAKFAQAGMFDLSRATEMLSGAQSAMGLAADDAVVHLENMTRVGDVLVKANTLAMASVEQFAEALSNKAAAAGKLANQSLEEVVSVLAAFAQQNRKGSEAGTAYNIVMREMTTKSLSNAAAWKAAGISAYTAGGKVRYLADIIADLEKKMGTMSSKEQAKLLMGMGFQAKSKIFIQMLLGSSDAIKGFKKELQEAGGFTEDVAGKQLPAFTDAMKKLWNVLGRIAILTIGPVLELIGRALLLMLWPIEKVVTGLELIAGVIGSKLGKLLSGMGKELLLTAEYWGLYTRDVKAAGKATGDTADEIDEANEEIAEQAEALDKWIAGLREEVEYFGKSQRVIQAYKHAKSGAIKDQAKLNEVLRAMGAIMRKERLAKDMEDHARALERQAAAMDTLMKRGRSVFESMRTPVEQFHATMNDLNKLLEVGAIDWQTYGRAARKALKEAVDASGDGTMNPAALQRGTQAAFTATLPTRAKGDVLAKKLDEQIRIQQEDQNLQQQMAIDIGKLVELDDVVIEM